ncbi:glyoxalase [Sporosarcina sp. P34]|uniref:VOC family protein n=1 Tax=Sporosarcina sp. P34 TaxID=2048247 RepID=UPI000C16C153|nr:VOC family protein [Sporosarcina sp. P34]PID15625.1 glyoxalase [Sporosarcina sp. P34]
MGRVVHFEIHVDDMERAQKFYRDVFGWTYQDWSEYAGLPYYGAVTDDDHGFRIDGALMQRQGPPPEPNQPLNGYACTMGIDEYDTTEVKILDHGGSVAIPKYALPGMAWQGYYLDTEGNIFGFHQPDKKAQ